MDAPTQIGNQTPPNSRIETALQNLKGIHEKSGIEEVICIAIVKGAPVPVVMAACSTIERAALLARFAADGLTHASIDGMFVRHEAAGGQG